MLRRFIFIGAFTATGLGIALAAGPVSTILPNGWRLSAPAGPLAIVGTMPQGIALSPDGTTLAVVESGVKPAALRLLNAKTLQTNKVIALSGAFGRPVWAGNGDVWIAAANSDAILDVDVAAGTSTSIPATKGSWPAFVALTGAHKAFSDDLSASVTIDGTDVKAGNHPNDLVFSPDGNTLYVSILGEKRVLAIDPAAKTIAATIAVGRHPGALALSDDGSKLFVAESDDDTVGIIDTKTNRGVADIPVGIHSTNVIHGYGANPNALLVHGNDLFVSLGGENAVALVRDRKVVRYIPAGWYPTGLAMSAGGTLYVSNGKGESAPPNPQLNPLIGGSDSNYVAKLTTGSVRAIPRVAYEAASSTATAYSDIRPLWKAPAHTILRAHGPITHVIYIIKENRSYDQVLGDIPGANGDPALAMFGRSVAPNQHAIAQRFGLFDNAYADAQVSADGHNWTDAATANDYVERTWPPNYAHPSRRDVFDEESGNGAAVPHSGYLWDAAKRAGVTYRDYGEGDIGGSGPNNIVTFPGLIGHYDPAYPGWNLKYSDLLRLAEWKREFRAFVLHRNLPQFEIVYLPNDHTSYSAHDMPTPSAYVAINDWAVGQLVDAVSHSPYWKSTAIFALEDDAQNGPDHVSDQRSTFYIASPYARGGTNHAHYSTVSVVRTIELLLGLPALSVRDGTTQPMYAAFALQPVNAKTYTAIKPSESLLNATNARTAYGAALSAHFDLSRPDTVDSRVGNDILEHNVRRQ